MLHLKIYLISKLYLPVSDEYTTPEVFETTSNQAPIRTTQGYVEPCGPRAFSIPFLRREDGSENFNRLWADYQAGFGDQGGEFWLGLDTLHNLTMAQSYELWVDMADYAGVKYCAKYAEISVGPESDKYRLSVTGFDVSSNAGDSIIDNPSIPADTPSHGMQFTTPDRDNDLSVGTHCGQYYNTGWWFSQCSSVGATAGYNSKLVWYSAKGGYDLMKYMQLSLVIN